MENNTNTKPGGNAKPSNADRTSGAGSPPGLRNSRQWTWKKILVVVVGVLVVGSVGRTVMPFDKQGAVDTTGDNNRSEPTQKPQSITLNGKKMTVGGQPVIVLNPGLARPGQKVSVYGSGFDPGGGEVDIMITDKAGKSDAKGKSVGTGKVGKDGSLRAAFVTPQSAATSNKQVVRAEQRNSKRVAEADAMVPQGMGMLDLYPEAGKPGDYVKISAQGFQPREKIKVYWGRMTGAPTMTLQADEHGSVGAQKIRVGVGATGKNVMILVGEKSTTVATAPFLMLGLYPSVTTKPYGAKATQKINFAGAGFAPGERVLVYVQGSGTPVMALKTDSGGKFGNAAVELPFDWEGKHSMIFMGEQSRASVASGFTVLPYSPSARPSTYAAMPGTSLRFNAAGFAPNEAVHVFAKRTKDSPGEMVTAFRVNQKGSAIAAGEYMIPSDVKGKFTINLVGAKSKGVAAATVNVENDGSVKLPPKPKYVLPPNLRN